MNPPEQNEVFVRILNIFRKEIYLPLVEEVDAPSKILKNSQDDLLEAIRRGDITYENGKFTGKFSAQTSKELRKLGAKWSKDGFKLKELPIEVRNAISIGKQRFSDLVSKVDSILQKILPAEITDKVMLEDLFEKSLSKTDKQIGKSLSVKPQLTKEQSQKIAEEYTQDMKRYIKDWTEKEIVSLRKKIQDSYLNGGRYESLIKNIKDSYHVSYGKAKFLARQETNLMVAKFKETRYLEYGVTEYKWSCVNGTPLHPVRPMHKALEGKIFSWKNPPVTNPEGQRNNPGQDYNCRCTAIPIIK